MRTRRLQPLVLALALLAGGCLRGSSPDADDPNAITLAIAASDIETHQQVADLWNERNPDTPLQIEALPESADQQRQQIGLEQNAQSPNFDVLAMDVIWTGEYAENGWIEDLSDLLPEVQENTLPGPIESAMYDGALWGLPYNSNAGLLYWRSDLLDEPPATWDEARTMWQEVVDSGEDIAGFAGQGAQYEGLVVNYLEFFWGAGGDVFVDGDETQPVFTEGDAALRAADFMREANQSGFFPTSFNTLQEDPARVAFQEGEVLFMRNWPFAVSLMEAEGSPVAGNFEVAPLPTFVEGESASTLGGFNLAVSAFSEKKDAALAFVRFASQDPDAQRILAENSLAPTLAATYEELADDPVQALLGEVIADANPRPPVPDYPLISIEIQDNIFSAYNGQQPTDVAVEAIGSRLQQIAGRAERTTSGGDG